MISIPSAPKIVRLDPESTNALKGFLFIKILKSNGVAAALRNLRNQLYYMKGLMLLAQYPRRKYEIVGITGVRPIDFFPRFPNTKGTFLR